MHKNCNLQRRRPKSFPVYLHGFEHFDSKLITSGLKYHKSIRCMARTSQTFRLISWSCWRFLDSLSILDGSLSELGDILHKDKSHKYSIIRSSNIWETEEQFRMTLKKSTFPYEKLSSLQFIRSIKVYPPRSWFYSSLKNQTVSEEVYLNGKKAFDVFHCQNMEQFLSLYCHIDNLVLAEVIFKFRNTLFNTFGLDVCNQIISLPQYSWQVLLKTCKPEIELMSEIDHVLQAENSIRGGLSQVGTRKFEKEGKRRLLYLDVNNLVSNVTKSNYYKTIMFLLFCCSMELHCHNRFPPQTIKP